MAKYKNPEFAAEFNKRLRARMEYLDISIARLTKLTGLPFTTVYALCIAKSDRVPHADTVAKIAQALGMTTDELINF